MWRPIIPWGPLGISSGTGFLSFGRRESCVIIHLTKKQGFPIPLCRFQFIKLIFISISELKQELQVRQKTIHETPDNEKLPQTTTVTTPDMKSLADESEKSDPAKSPSSLFAVSNNNNKLSTAGTPPLKRKCTAFFLILETLF